MKSATTLHIDLSSQGERELRFKQAALELRQDKPYLNQRPINTRTLLPNETCLDFLTRKIPVRDRTYWTQALENHEITRGGKPLSAHDVIRSGDSLIHTLWEAPEPPISSDIEILFEDDSLMVVNKPAPLPVHPCGRYRFHTFTEIAKHAWPDLELRLLHRLDSETSGILVLDKKRMSQSLGS